MTDTLKILGQSAPSATTLTDIYTVPGATSAVVSSITVCNRSATPTSFRISIAPAGAADATSQYIYYDVPINGNDSFQTVAGFSLATTDKIRVYTTLSTTSFTVTGVEVT